MYKTAVYTLVNGGIQGLTHQKSKNHKKCDIVCITMTVMVGPSETAKLRGIVLRMSA